MDNMMSLPANLDDQGYSVRLGHDLNNIGLLFDDFDAINASAVMCIRDRFNNLNTLYCGNPVYAMICFSSLLNKCISESCIQIESFMTMDELTDRISPMAYEDKNNTEFNIDDSVKLTEARSAEQAKSVDESAFLTFNNIKLILSQYQMPNESWFLSASVDGKTASVFNCDYASILRPLRFAIGHFIANVNCPFCNNKMDFAHFMKHVSEIQNRTTDY